MTVDACPLPAEPGARRRLLTWIALWAVAGLALRLAGARGGLWLDEAVSAAFARDAGTPARVLFSINHDNNHHLNTLWLLATGWGAAPVLERGLSIVTGTLAVVAAGLLVGRRSARGGVLAAALFALSPLLVTYGAEARGYAPMLLATVAAWRLVDGWLADPVRPPPARALGAVAAFGILSHLTFAYALAVTGGWAAWELAAADPRGGWRAAARRWAALMGHALLATAAVLALIWLAARASPDGFRFGSYKPFTPADWADGMQGMLAFALGDPWPATRPWLAGTIVVATLAALRWTPGLGRRRSLYAIAILLLPLAMGAARIGNAYCPRYYLVSAAALLLLGAEALAALLTTRGGGRGAAVAALGMGALGAAALDRTIATNLRGDPARAIAAMRPRAPAGATVLADQTRNVAVLGAASASASYALAVTTAPCGRARFLFVDVERLPFPAEPMRCGTRYRAVTSGYAYGLSGLHWRLYERL